MAENPLLPHAELRALHRSLLQVLQAGQDESPRSRGSALPGMEALLAGTFMQLRGGDVVVSGPGETPQLSALLADKKGQRRPSPKVSLYTASEGSPSLLLAAGLAAALRRAGEERTVLAFVPSEAASLPAPSKWLEALTWAQEETAPLIVAIADPSGTDAFRTASNGDPKALSWTTLQRPAARLQLPVLSVDGEDAVAVYRVMQESLLRARSGGGPAVLWAALPAPTLRKGRRPRIAPVQERLERYLSARSIAFS